MVRATEVRPTRAPSHPGRDRVLGTLVLGGDPGRVPQGHAQLGSKAESGQGTIFLQSLVLMLTRMVGAGGGKGHSGEVQLLTFPDLNLVKGGH